MLNIKKVKKNKGFVILFAVMLSGLILSIALGVASVALKEVKFGTSAKDTNNAFFAADTGIECAFFYDRSPASVNAYTGTASMSCGGAAVTLSGSAPLWNFVITGLGSDGLGCAKVTVDKSVSPTTTVISKGYNVGNASCTSSNPNRVEREIDAHY